MNEKENTPYITLMIVDRLNKMSHEIHKKYECDFNYIVYLIFCLSSHMLKSSGHSDKEIQKILDSAIFQEVVFKDRKEEGKHASH